MSPSKLPVLSMTIQQELLDRLDDFFHENRFRSRAEAVKWLLKEGLDRGLKPEGKTKK